MAFRILFIGLVGSGKSFLASKCAELTKGEVVTFAEKVYLLAEKILNRPVDKAQPGDRELLKLIGTSWGREGVTLDSKLEDALKVHWKRRHGYKDIWVEALIRRVEELHNGVSIFNDDTRFYNELITLTLQLNFLPVFVACTEEERIKRLKKRGETIDPNKDGHKSEAMAKELSQFVLEIKGVPVIWNDQSNNKIKSPWVVDVDEFFKAIKMHSDNYSLLEIFSWDFGILNILAQEVKNG